MLLVNRIDILHKYINVAPNTMAFNIFTCKLEPQFLGFSNETRLTNHSFIKRYPDISGDQWKRVTEAARAMSDAKIGPEVYSINHQDHSIEYQRVIPLKSISCDIVDKQRLIRQVKDKIVAMHQLGWAHGDLHPDNIGVYDDNVYILDHDSMFRIADGITPWVLCWMSFMSCLRDWDGTFEGFVALDYKWQHDW